MDPDVISVKMASVAGAVISMQFINGTIPAKISMGLAGVTLSYYLSPWLSDVLEVPPGVSGFLCGFLGMSVMSKCWEIIKDIPASLIWKALIEKIKK